MPTSVDLRALLRHPVDFEMADSPDESRFVFTTPNGEERATASEAIGPLSQGIRTMNAHPSVRAWATPAILALRLMARGHLNEPDDSERTQLQDAARSVDPQPARAQAKVRAFLDALAVDAPSVATTPQRPAPQPAGPERIAPRTFAVTLQVTFAPEPSADIAATIVVRGKPIDTSWGAADIADVWARDGHHFGRGAKQGLRNLMATASSIWSPTDRVLDDPDIGQITVSEDELRTLGSPRVVAALSAHRIEIAWPESLIRDVDTRAVVRRVESGTIDRPRAFSPDQVFRFDWQVALGDDILTEAEVDELARAQHGLLRLRDQWVFVDPTRLQRVLWQRSREIEPAQALQAAASGRLELDGIGTEVDTVGWLDDVRRRLSRRPQDLPAITQPDGLDGTLRDYQLDGMRWMAQLTDLGLGGCLADDMGLGKTVMLIALHLHRRSLGERRPTLVVCPASVVGNWVREIERFAPGIPVRRHHGTGRTLDELDGGFVVTTYATMRRDADDLAQVEWALVVADEAQNVKNVRASASRALRSIPAETRMALTGTPVENNLAELWAILDWTTPGLLGGHDEFRAHWSRRIERHGDTDRAEDLSHLIRPFVLRRRKSDPGIAPELPPKIETDYRVSLTREQVGLYQAVVRETMAQIEAAQGIQRRGLVVKLLTQLKQICNHPAQFLRQPDAALNHRSGKLAMLDELLEEILSEDGAALVFTQYAQMGHLLERHLRERSVRTQFLHGGTPVRMREAMVRDFQSGQVPVFLLSLKAAGTGLNLTRADHVIHYDRWWNPAVEDQATDRAHRIGQTSVVHVHRLVNEGTIEESVAELITSKRALADAVINSGESALTELSDRELADLVRLRR